MREADVLVCIQRTFADRPGVLPAARAMSHFGEHALGWMGLGALGALVQPSKRQQWIRLAGASFCSHAASVVIKRIVRRKRPHDPRIEIGVATPSKLSFPSSHATSTTAALLSLAYICGKPWPLAGVPVMMFSRMVLGVHYPSDVAAGAGIGAATAVIMKGSK
ncbi:phosphatase PAP2 family protein [Corynebacterium pelargi]|uniref:PAP2 superfamily protein n=1 Tax=Corynebacterium pelargi TaxID=1471400 RepID=A0A410W6H5_9CORY|nr:phosphatase PAP2 family protein [Corynebacterium pelargi]QAU51484.1 PAP2 superfamily protein [Corynebacterium pelargi]GGG79487.1 phosphatase PAP2 family protein [Corynebacterium pelargi]